MAKILTFCTATFLGLFVAVPVPAQVSVSVGGQRIEVQNGKGRNVSVNRQGEIAEDAEISGVTVINDDVFIDGIKIPRGTKTYTSKKTGKTYRIQWGKNGNVSVEEK